MNFPFLRALRGLSVLTFIALPWSQVAHGAGVTAIVQAGHDDDRTSSYGLGIGYGWQWSRRIAMFDLTGRTEGFVGQWRVADSFPGAESRFTQIGVTPILRIMTAAGAQHWFLDVGIGANIIFPKFEDRARHFGTLFNFGDSIATGVRLGESHEVALRLEHFSNGGISHPNPGQNFLQLRYARHF